MTEANRTSNSVAQRLREYNIWAELHESRGYHMGNEALREIERLTREHLAEAAAHDTTRRERAEDVKEVSRLRAALRAALSGAIRYVGYDCADCGMQVLEGRSVCRKSGNPHTPPKNGLGSSRAADETSTCNCPEVCKVCGGRASACAVLGHRSEANSVNWHECPSEKT